MRRTAAASLLSTFALPLMAGCGGGDPAPASTTEESSAGTEVAETPPVG